MKDTLENTNPSGVNAQSTQVVTTNPNPTEFPSAWMQYGTSPTEIILAIAILLKVLVPVMHVNSSHKRK